MANDTTDLGNYSRTETLSANVDKVVLQWERASGFVRIGGTLNIRSSSGVIVTLDFIGLTWPAGGVSGLCAIRGTATMGT